MLDVPSKFLDMEKLKSQKDLLDAHVRLNIQRIEKKQRQSSQTVELESLADVLNAVKGLVTAANAPARRPAKAIVLSQGPRLSFLFC